MWRLPYFLIAVYRRLISPLLPATCRFHPTCSAYGMEALRSHGLMRGGWLTVRRVCRCHPWHPGGLDPVPGAPDSHTREETASSLLTTPPNGDTTHG